MDEATRFAFAAAQHGQAVEELKRKITTGSGLSGPFRLELQGGVWWAVWPGGHGRPVSDLLNRSGVL